MPKDALALLFTIDRLAEALPVLRAGRAAVRAARTRTDRRLRPVLRDVTAGRPAARSATVGRRDRRAADRPCGAVGRPVAPMPGRDPTRRARRAAEWAERASLGGSARRAS